MGRSAGCTCIHHLHHFAQLQILPLLFFPGCTNETENNHLNHFASRHLCMLHVNLRGTLQRHPFTSIVIDQSTTDDKDAVIFQIRSIAIIPAPIIQLRSSLWNVKTQTILLWKEQNATKYLPLSLVVTSISLCKTFVPWWRRSGLPIWWYAKDFVSISSIFNVTHLSVITRIEKAPYFRLCHLPRRSMITYKALKYTQCDRFDCEPMDHTAAGIEWICHCGRSENNVDDLVVVQHVSQDWHSSSAVEQDQLWSGHERDWILPLHDQDVTGRTHQHLS